MGQPGRYRVEYHAFLKVRRSVLPRPEGLTARCGEGAGVKRTTYINVFAQHCVELRVTPDNTCM